MAYRSFTFNIIVRVLLIVINCFFLVTEYISGRYLISIINLGILLIVQTSLLIYFLRRINIQVLEYFDLLKDKETGSKLKIKGYSNILASIRKRINDTSQTIQELRIEKEVQTNYLGHLVQHIKVGLISFDQNEKIQFINPEAKRLLAISNISTLNELEHINEDLVNLIRNIKPGDSEVIRIDQEESYHHLSFNCGILTLLDTKIKMISFQDIDKHLYKKELDSWNKLIRILNHEIMNSVTPITSLTKTIKNYFQDGNTLRTQDKITIKEINRTIEGLSIIEERGKGLINFVNNYRKLSNLPAPNITKVDVYSLLKQMQELFTKELDDNNIEMIIHASPNKIYVHADIDLISQVLINLIQNSIQSLHNQKDKKIELSESTDNYYTNISVTDNGKGIPKEILHDIFIPFYTTKENGSGVGLSISKQIMRMHNGSISVNSDENKSTKFTLSFSNK